MSVSVPGIISALAMKPMPPMLARSIASDFASLIADATAAPEPAPVEAPAEVGGAAPETRLDTRA